MAFHRWQYKFLTFILGCCFLTVLSHKYININCELILLSQKATEAMALEKQKFLFSFVSRNE